MCGVRAEDNQLIIPKSCGEGYVYTFNFNSGISVAITDLNMREELEIKRNQYPVSQYFVLLFNDNNERTNFDASEKSNYDKFDLRKKIVRLSSSLIASNSILPANFKIRSVIIIFNKQSLLNFIDFETADKFINLYFPIYLKKNFVAPMDAAYRWILQDIYNEIPNHPLPHLYSENRVMLLLEKFMYNFMVREKHITKKTTV